MGFLTLVLRGNLSLGIITIGTIRGWRRDLIKLLLTSTGGWPSWKLQSLFNFYSYHNLVYVFLCRSKAQISDRLSRFEEARTFHLLFEDVGSLEKGMIKT